MEAPCNCKKVRVKVNDDELFSKPRGHICHCLNCQRTSGSALATNLVIETSKVQITGEDNLSIYEDGDSLSGNTVYRFFCKTCGNPIKSETDATRKNGMTILKLGIFCDKIPEPEMEAFVVNRQSWLPAKKGAPQYKTARGGERVDQ